MKLVLASTSRPRRELLSRLGVPFSVAPHRVDEDARKPAFTTPDAVALGLSREKAESLRASYPDAYILGSDQVVDLDGEVLGKPGSKAAAEAQIARLAGRSHRLLTGIALASPDGTMASALDVHVMTMRPLDAAEIARYVAADDPSECAGAYKIEALGISLFSRIEGADFTAIPGLPLLTVLAMLRDAGLQIP
jgi:septum formation protein